MQTLPEFAGGSDGGRGTQGFPVQTLASPLPAGGVAGS